MFNMLEQLGLEFISEYSPDWIKPKRYDFYIPSMNLIIEMDGRFHYNNNYNSLKETQYNDNYKNKLAKKNGIKVIRIDCNYNKNPLEYIKYNVVNSELNKIIDMSKINWNEIDKFALSSLMKQVCEYKRDNPNIFANDIGKIYSISKSATISYLKKGSQIWEWCNYNPIEERKRGIQKFNKTKNNICI